jgi:hypothetical protein
MAKQNVVHVKLEYQEALESKKALLATQLNSIKLSKIMKRYWLLRAKECNLKEQANVSLKQLKKHLIEILKQLPETDMPDIFKRGRKRQELNQIQNITEESESDYRLEKELKEIQEKLARLQE